MCINANALCLDQLVKCVLFSLSILCCAWNKICVARGIKNGKIKDFFLSAIGECDIAQQKQDSFLDVPCNKQFLVLCRRFKCDELQ